MTDLTSSRDERVRDGNEIQASSLSALESPIARYCLSRFSRTTRPCRDFIVESRVSLALRSYLDRTSHSEAGRHRLGACLGTRLGARLGHCRGLAATRHAALEPLDAACEGGGTAWRAQAEAAQPSAALIRLMALAARQWPWNPWHRT